MAPVPHGEGLHHGLELLTGAGLAPLEALRAATSLPAKHFGLEGRGIIEPRKRADLVPDWVASKQAKLRPNLSLLEPYTWLVWLELA